MKHHAIIVIKRACTLLFSLCLLAGLDAYADCVFAPVELKTFYSLDDEALSF